MAMALPRSLPVFDHLHQEGLPAGHVKGVDQTLKGAQDQDLPNRDSFGERQPSQQQGLHGGQGLGPEQHLPAIQAVDPYAGERGQQEGGDLSHEADQAQQQGGASQPVDQPTGGDPRHPGADEGNTLSAEEQPEVAVP